MKDIIGINWINEISYWEELSLWDKAFKDQMDIKLIETLM